MPLASPVANQNCAEAMLETAAKRVMQLTLDFDYPVLVSDEQVDLSPALAGLDANDDSQVNTLMWTSGQSAESLLQDFSKLDKDKSYFLRTGTSGGAGHYQLIYFESDCWVSYSTSNNYYKITTSEGELSERARGALLVEHQSWGHGSGQYCMMLTEVNPEVIIATANYVYTRRTQGADIAIAQAFQKQAGFIEGILQEQTIDSSSDISDNQDEQSIANELNEVELSVPAALNFDDLVQQLIQSCEGKKLQKERAAAEAVKASLEAARDALQAKTDSEAIRTQLLRALFVSFRFQDQTFKTHEVLRGSSEQKNHFLNIALAIILWPVNLLLGAVRYAKTGKFEPTIRFFKAPAHAEKFDELTSTIDAHTP